MIQIMQYSIFFFFFNLNSISWEHLLCVILIFFSLLLNSKTRTPMETYENASTPTSSLNQTPRNPKELKHLARAGQLHPNRPWPANHLPPQRVPAVSLANHVSAPVPPANQMQPLHPLPQRQHRRPRPLHQQFQRNRHPARPQAPPLFTISSGLN